MKRLTLTVLFVMMGSLAYGQAQTPAAAAPSAPAVPGNKIVTIDFTRALLESAPGKAFTVQHEKETAPEIAKMEKLAKEIADLQVKLQAAKTDAERRTINDDIQKRQTEGVRIREDAERLSESLKQSLLPPIGRMVEKAVADWAKAQTGVALVLDPSSEPTNVVYANQASEITNEVIRAVDAAYEKDPKLAAPQAAPAAPAGAAPAAAPRQ
jgi:Skp family chaperone for outer membrane proteins